MQLVNVTPLVAELGVAELPGSPLRAGILHAKASYGFDLEGRVQLERERPFPLFVKDEPTELGVLPRDDFPAWDARFDVILLGQAHAPGGRPVREMSVGLSVGETRRELVVTGDRTWIGEGAAARVSDPTPFTSMPLTYARAFGGSAEVLIDRASPVDMSDPRNPAGKGWDVSAAVKTLTESIKPPPGYPTWEKGPRALPNLEHPHARILRWEDQPPAACWATLPLESATHALRSVDQSQLQNLDPARYVHPLAPFHGMLFHRAADEWVLPQKPAPNCKVVLDGLLRERPHLELTLPAPSVKLDVSVGDDSAALSVSPQMLVLLPEALKFYVVYRVMFRMRHVPTDARSARLRIE